jgi:GTP-binding protein
MIIKNVNLDIVCGITSKLPETTLPEFAFAGKSNVGKSSLINALINRKSYARTSSEPGKTQTINFYKIDCRSEGAEGEKMDRELYYVDLPGYGYARVSQSEREKWGVMIENYLNQSKRLLGVFLLVDIRHEPSANDCQMFDWIVSQGYRPVVIATKMDKINRSQLAKQVKTIRTKLGMEKEDLLFPFSAQTKQGREEIWAYIEGQL